MHELPAAAFEVARPLFDRISELQLSAAAVLDGECEGRLVVDDAARPRSALLTTPEGSLFAGDPDNLDFVAALRRFVWDELFGRERWQLVYATVDGTGWERRLAEIAAPRDVIRVARRHYECRAPVIDWRPLVPEGFEVRPVDAVLLDDEALAVPDHLRDWIQGNWGSRDRFLARGFGAATVRRDAVVSWSLADCRSADRCEIGIQTLRDYRRQGLATVTAAAAVEHALSAGLRVVGWHCNEDNLGSSGTAEKVGFVLERRYESLYFYAEEAEELAEKGWIASRAGRPSETVALYRRVFELRPESPHFQYVLAARAAPRATRLGGHHRADGGCRRPPMRPSAASSGGRRSRVAGSWIALPVSALCRRGAIPGRRWPAHAVAPP